MHNKDTPSQPIWVLLIRKSSERRGFLARDTTRRVQSRRLRLWWRTLRGLVQERDNFRGLITVRGSMDEIIIG